MPRTSPDAFLGAGPESASYPRALFVVIPVGYEGTVTYVRGTRDGPAAILDASLQVETYDETLRWETCTVGIHCLPLLRPRGTPDRVARRLEETAAGIIRDGKIPVVIGGEHSLSLGPVRAARKAFPELGVVHLDAHTDLRDSYEGTIWGHGCVMRRVLEACPGTRIAQVGIRSLSKEEADLVAAKGRVRTFFAHERRPGRWPPRGLLAGMPEAVYLSIDMDVFDPSAVPGVGTPEPGGLDWDEVVAVAEETARSRRIVGFDVVETRPIPGSVVSEFTAAKLIYRIMGLIARSRSRGGGIAPRRPRR